MPKQIKPLIPQEPFSLVDRAIEEKYQSFGQHIVFVEYYNYKNRPSEMSSVKITYGNENRLRDFTGRNKSLPKGLVKLIESLPNHVKSVIVKQSS